MDYDDNSGWLVQEPINPFALAPNDEGEEVGLKKIHLPEPKNELDLLLVQVHNWIINKPMEF